MRNPIYRKYTKLFHMLKYGDTFIKCPYTNNHGHWIFRRSKNYVNVMHGAPTVHIALIFEMSRLTPVAIRELINRVTLKGKI